jgi:stage V sporulation protein G
MQITEIKINLSTQKSSIKAYASITLDNLLVIHNIKILDGLKGMFIAMPSRKVSNRFLDIVHPLNSEFRKDLQDKILAEYDRVKGTQINV